MSNFKINKPMHVFQKISAVAFLLIVMLFLACKKDFDPTTPYTTKQRIEGPVSVEEAKYTFGNSWATRADDREYQITIDSITPLWDAAVNSEYANTADILIVPIAPDSNRLPGGGGNLVFFRTQDSLLDYRMLIHIPDSTYWDSSEHRLITHTFTGAIVLVGPGGTVGDAFFFDGGTFIGTDGGEVSETVAPDGGCDDPNPDLDCYSFGPSFWKKIGSFFSNIWTGLGNVFGGSGGSGGGNTTILNWGGAFSGIYPSYNYDPNSSGGGSGPTKLSDYFDVTLLEGIERKNAIEINKFKDKYCLYTPAAEILNQLTAKCNLSDDPNELFGQIKENLYTSITILPECVEQVIIDDRIQNIQDEYNIEVSAEDLKGFIGEPRIYSCDTAVFNDVVQEYNALWSNCDAPPEGEALSLPGAFSCFESSCSDCTYSVTLYIEQPVPLTREIYTTKGGSGGSSGGGGSSYRYTGHTFLGLTQNKPSGESKTRILGFYPYSKPRGKESVAAAFWDDSGTSYNISVAWTINYTQFNQVMDELTAYHTYGYYNVGKINCTIVAKTALEAAGIEFWETKRQVLLLGWIDANPADFGEDLRINPQGGNFHSTTGITLEYAPSSTCE